MPRQESNLQPPLSAPSWFQQLVARDALSLELRGRPPKLLSTIVAELREQGYERASAANVVDAFEKPEDLMKVIHDFIHRCGDEVK